jgi:integrase/recombinase XerD
VAEVQAVREEHLARYHEALKTSVNRFGKPVSANYIYRAMMVPKIFLIWAREAGFVLLDFSGFRLQRPTRKAVDVPGVDQVARLLEAPDVGRPEGLRDRLILEFFYTLGVRRRECHGLSIEDLDLKAGTVLVAGKGYRERLLPLSPRLVALLTRYLWNARLKLRPHADETALWISPQTGRRLGYSYLHHLVVDLCAQLGLEMRPHLLRHACATHLLEAGADIDVIQTLLGHKRPASTGIYARVKPLELATEFFKCHPRAR